MSDILWTSLDEVLNSSQDIDFGVDFWKTGAGKNYPKRDVYQDITDRVVDSLHKGTAPWQKPWDVNGIMPTSVSTNRPYRGINQLLLGLTQQAKGYSSPHWLTYNQAKAKGGNVIKGEKGSMVTLWKEHEVDDATHPTGKRNIPFLRAYSVFNTEQCEGLQLPPRFHQQQRDPVETLPALQGIMDGYQGGPKQVHGLGDSAHYSRRDDTITLPEKTQFKTPEGYASTVLHEMTHSTGHKDRLDRFDKTGEPSHFGSEQYGHEELTAELGNAFLRGHAGIGGDHEHEQSAAYIQSWLGALSDPDNKKWVVQAAGHAQKAADHILGINPANLASEPEKPQE
jgi:antirestriction protein ArdC